MGVPVTPKVPFGGGYNPEQWPEGVWEQDYRLFDRAAIDTVTLGIFAWASTQPGPDTYDFSMLDRIVGVLGTHLLRLGRDPTAVHADRTLARPGPHRFPGHHPGLPAVHVGGDAGQLP